MTFGKLLVCETGSYPQAVKHVYPVLCNHCREPACVEACPTGANQKRDDGVVWIDPAKCIGCKFCVAACPYQMRTYFSDRKDYFPGQGPTEYERLADRLHPLKNDTVVKCDFCRDRLDAGARAGLKPGTDLEATPACVNICPAKARYFGDLDDAAGEVSDLVRTRAAVQLHPGFGTDPSVYYILSPAMLASRFVSHSLFPASSKYSLPFFLMTAKEAKRDSAPNQENAPHLPGGPNQKGSPKD